MPPAPRNWSELVLPELARLQRLLTKNLDAMSPEDRDARSNGESDDQVRKVRA